MGVRRGGRWLLRPVTFGVPEGVVGLAGPPGAGKSTLLATFATLRRPNAGLLRILGHDISNAAGLRAARAGIGYLPARFSRAENMTAGEFVAYAAYYKRQSASAARSMLKRLDLADAAGTELALLPPEVRLRAGLAAACVHAPSAVLLDDPFGALCAAAEPWPTGADGPGRSTLTAAMSELIPVVRALAPTVVVTADATETLTGWCDRLFTLARGRLTEQPTHSSAARRGRSAADRRGAGVGVPDPQHVGALDPARGRPDVDALGRRSVGALDSAPDPRNVGALEQGRPGAPGTGATGVGALDPAPGRRGAGAGRRRERRPGRAALPRFPLPAGSATGV
ncbi:ATP-binding cassette domain-containing protein [Actinomadura bangladeshensis]|nr:ATP-binding cassette domain-containing protein [Actinomadura bangladeshensis]